jgi:hypothetical protein
VRLVRRWNIALATCCVKDRVLSYALYEVRRKTRYPPDASDELVTGRRGKDFLHVDRQIIVATARVAWPMTAPARSQSASEDGEG